MGATLTGVPLYARHGYVEVERSSLPFANGDSLAIVRMVKGNQQRSELPSSNFDLSF